MPHTPHTWANGDVVSAALLNALETDLAAAVSWNVTGKTGAYTATAGDYVLADTTGGTFAVTAPSPGTGKLFGVKWKAGTVAPTLVGTFNSAPVFNVLDQAIEFISDGTTWYRTVRPALAQLPDYPAATDARYDALGAATTAQGASLQKTANLSDLASAATARTNLGLGTAATQPSSAFLGATAQAVDSAKIGGITVTGTPAAGQSIVAASTTAATWAVPAITGQYLGSAATYAGLPTTDAAGQPASNGDWAFLNVDVIGTGTATAPQYPRGAYVTNGTTFTLGLALGADFIIGTSAGTIAAGNDSRITGAAQAANNLSDLTNASTARTNLGLGTAATQATSSFDAAGAAAAIRLGGTVNAITSNATAVVGVRNTVDGSAGPVTVTLPTPTAVGQHLIIERLDASAVTANTITISGTIRGVTSSTATLPAVGAANEGALWIAESLTSWTPASSLKPKAWLDAVYTAKNAAQPGLGAGFWHSGSNSQPAGSPQSISLTNTDFNDSTSLYTLSSGNAVVATAGLYLINFFVDFASGNGSGIRDMLVKVGASTIAESAAYTDGSELRMAASRVIRLAAGATIGLYSYTPSVAVTINGSSARDSGVSIALIGS